MKKITKFTSFLLAICLAFIIIGCGENIEISFEDEQVTIVAGSQLELELISNLEDLDLVWESDDENVVTVDNGKITGVNPGEATITVTVKEKDITASILVKVNPVSISFDQTTITISVDEEKTLVPIVTPAQAISYTWVSSNTEVVTVVNGKIKGIAEGNAVVSASGKGGVANITVNVVLPVPSMVSIINPVTDSKVGMEVTLNTLVLPAKASQEIIWESNDEEIAVVNESGKVTFVGIGQVTITAKSKVKTSVETSLVINVDRPDPQTVTVYSADGVNKVAVGETLQLSASISPDLADQGVIWSTEDTTIATIDANGLLTGLKSGTVKVIATSEVSSSVFGELTIEVVLPNPTSVEVTGPETIIQVDEELQLTARVFPIWALQSVTYLSSNNEIATVDENGLVSGVTAGDVVITVKSTVDETLYATYNVKVIEAIVPDFSHILIDENLDLDAERFSTITVNNIVFILGVNAFRSLAQGFEKIEEGSTVIIKAGTYGDNVAINFNNVTILGPNVDVNPVTNLENRLPEASLQGVIQLGEVENILISGIELKVRGQIRSSKPLKNITIDHISTVGVVIDAAQGVIFFGLSNDEHINENIVVKNSSFHDTGAGYRGVRINNVVNLIVQDCYFHRFFDAIRLEGTGNSGWVEPGFGVGASGIIKIIGNKFENNIQYPIVFGRSTATQVDVLNNYIGINPNVASGIFGIFYINNHIIGDYKTVVNVQYNVIPYCTHFHDFRFKADNATTDHIEINVNYNIFHQKPFFNTTAQAYRNHIINHSNVNWLINGKYNIFLYEDEVRDIFFTATDYKPYFTTTELALAFYLEEAILEAEKEMYLNIGANVKDYELEWTSSDTNIITVDENGKLYGVASGDATITATIKGTDVSASILVSVIIPTPETIVVEGYREGVNIGDETQLTASVLPALANQNVIFESSDIEVATVSETGFVTAVGTGTVIITVRSAEVETVLYSYQLQVFNVNFQTILLDESIDVDLYTTITVDDIEYVVGLNAFNNSQEAFSMLVDGSTIIVKAGTYSGNVNVNVNNVTVLGPNFNINPVTNLEDRILEAIFRGGIILGQVENILIEGIQLTGGAQIRSSLPVKNVTLNNIYTVASNVDGGQGVIFLGLSNNSHINENIIVKNSFFNDSIGQGNRAVRVNNAHDITIIDNKFIGYFDPIRLEGTSNSGFGALGTGSGAAGHVIITDNTFEMTKQYPIMLARYTATQVDILRNTISVDPDAANTFGTIMVTRYDANYNGGNFTTVVNIMHNEFLTRCKSNEIRFRTEEGTPEQLQINVNYNIFHQTPMADRAHIINHTDTSTITVNGNYNVYLYEGEVLSGSFVKTSHDVKFRTLQELEDHLNA